MLVIIVVLLLALNAYPVRLRGFLARIGNGNQRVVLNRIDWLVGVGREGNALVRVVEVAVAGVAEVEARALWTHPHRSVEQ